MNCNIDPNKAVTWLHLSDLHACNPKTGWEAKSILDCLKKDLIKLRDKQGLIPDLIFFTGDAAFGHLGKEDGKSITDQFKEAAKFLDEVRNLYSPAVPKENLFLVPGNHDVNRGKVIDGIHMSFDFFNEMKPDEVRERLMKMIRDNDNNWKGVMQALEDYRSFLEENGYKHLLTDRDRLIFGETRRIKGIDVGIAGLNSAWSCYKDGGKGKLWLAGNWQIRTLHAKVKDANLRIALSHHPFNWFNEVEDPHLERSIGNHFDFFLHGHEHEDWVKEVKRMVTTISTGACYAGSDKERGYNIVQWEPRRKRGNVWLRIFKEIGYGWVADLIPGITDDTGGVWQIGDWDDKAVTLVATPEIPASVEKTAETTVPVPATVPSLTNIKDIVKENIRKTLSKRQMKCLRRVLEKMFRLDNKGDQGVLQIADRLLDSRLLNAIIQLQKAVLACLRELEDEGSSIYTVNLTWTDCVTILGWMVLTGVEDQWARKAAHDLARSGRALKMMIPVKTELGLDIAVSRLNEVEAKFKLDKISMEVLSKTRISSEEWRVESGWSLDRNALLLKQELWKQLNRIEGSHETFPETLDDDLNQILYSRRCMGENHYLVMNLPGKESSQLEGDIMLALMRDLPNLDIFYLGNAQEGGMAIVGETQLQAQIREFLLIKNYIRTDK